MQGLGSVVACWLLLQGSWLESLSAYEVTINPRFGITPIRSPTTPVQLLCSARDGARAVPLAGCQFLQGGAIIDLSQGAATPLQGDAKYQGAGLERGECGASLGGSRGWGNSMIGCRVRAAEGGGWKYAAMVLDVSNFLLMKYELQGPKEILVMPGSDVTIAGLAELPLDRCRIHLSDTEWLDFNQGHGSATTGEVKYHGKGLLDMECGATLSNLTPERSGFVRVGVKSPAPPGQEKAYRGVDYVSLIVASPPEPPRLVLPPKDYVVGDLLRATCTVANGRPVANITWYIGDAVVRRDRLNNAAAGSEWRWSHDPQTIAQNLVHKVNAADDGKALMCRAEHFALPGGTLDSDPHLLKVLASSPCRPNPCGPNSLCQVSGGRAACSCQPTFQGSPPSCTPAPATAGNGRPPGRPPSRPGTTGGGSWRPGTTGGGSGRPPGNNGGSGRPPGTTGGSGRPQAGSRGCGSDADCPGENRGCVRGACQDLCPGPCAEDAVCRVDNSQPICSCPEGFIGDPFVKCEAGACPLIDNTMMDSAQVLLPRLVLKAATTNREEVLQASCVVRQCLVIANVTWYLGEEVLQYYFINDSPEDVDVSSETITQHLGRRKLSWHDNGKELRCQVSYFGLNRPQASATLVYVKCPRLERGPSAALVLPPQLQMTRTHYIEGDLLQATCVVRQCYVVEAITWFLGGQLLEYHSIKEAVVNGNEAGEMRPITLQLSRKKLSWKDNGKELKCQVEVTGAGALKISKQLVIVQFKDAADVSAHRNLVLINSKLCGHVPIDIKISHGTDSGLFQYPWMALLLLKGNEKDPGFCGGTIINSRYILTAAHCVADTVKIPTARVIVRLGEYDVNSVLDCSLFGSEQRCASPTQDLSIAEVKIHPKYNPRVSLNYDIALLRVDREINFGTVSVRPVCLPVGFREQQRQFSIREKLTVTGWGVTHTGYQSPILQVVQLSAVSLDDCAKKYQRTNYAGMALNISNDQMCAGGERLDACAGDSGGPLVAAGRDGITQYGIVSFGQKVCGFSLPGVYTRVGHYMPWIMDSIKP